MALAGYQSAVSQAEQALARVRKSTASLLNKARSDVETKKLALATKTKALEKLEQQLEYCTIRSPSEGLVVYVYDDEDFRIAEGAVARERQRLIRLPDTSRMKVEMKVNEGQVGKLKLGQRASIRVAGIKDPLGAVLTKVSPVASTGSRWWNPDLKEYPVELELDDTPPDLKPGMTAEAELYVQRLPDVLAVPLPAVWSEQSTSYVFVREGDKVVPRPVKLGAASHTQAQVLEGLAKGESVMLLGPGQGRELLERAGIATGSDLATTGPPPPPQHAKARPEQRAKPEQQAKQAKGQEVKPKPEISKQPALPKVSASAS
jgi:multidrug efflux pump subunit AcrA (membrane-fusion protein)